MFPGDLLLQRAKLGRIVVFLSASSDLQDSPRNTHRPVKYQFLQESRTRMLRTNNFFFKFKIPSVNIYQAPDCKPTLEAAVRSWLNGGTA